MIDRWMMLISFLNCCSRALRHATLTPKHLRVPYRSSTFMRSKNTRAEFGILEELAAKVVRGAAEKVVPIGSQLKRKKSWNLFLGEADREFSGVAILVVNKKSAFTLDDAHTAIGIIEDEGSARYLQDPDTTARQLLLTTRGDIVPAAGAFLRSARIGESSDGITTITMRWEQLEGLVHDGRLGKYLDAASLSTSPGVDQSLFQSRPSVSLPVWLREDREQRTKAKFDLRAPFEPSGDQPQAIEALVRGVESGKRHQTLLGATGTGKTFIVANVIQKASLPTLVLAPNKVLAAQLTNELRALFPNNAVEYFVSYYDYYMPEAFVSSSDTYIDKVVQINDDIDRMRHSATRSLLERRDVIVVASVSCIYGLGMPNKYLEASIRVAVGQSWDGGWRTLAQHFDQKMFYSPQLSEEQFWANPRGSFRAVSCQDGGGVIEVGPAAEDVVIRVGIDLSGLVKRIQVVSNSQNDPGTSAMFEEVAPDVPEMVAAGAVRGMDVSDIGRDGKTVPKGQGANDVEAHVIYPARHHILGEEEMNQVLATISVEMEERCSQLGREGRVLEAERLRQRTENDLLLIRAVGTCKGIENYSRHLAGRCPGEPPETLVDYFPQDDWLLVVDESHVSAPQLGAMFGGDRARKEKLVEHGFRLPSALDNRPLKAGEFWSKVKKSIFVSATPGKFELELSNPGNLRRTSLVAEHSKYPHEKASKNTSRGDKGLGWDVIEDLVDAQAVIRPTGITDPPVEIRNSENQVSDLVRECKAKRELGERVLVTALTKRMAEDLSVFLVEQGVPTAYLHSEVKPMHRLQLLQQLRKGEVDVIVGVNLLREGLNLPEVSLVCILDADAEGFLRSDTALLQMIGRATRHEDGRAVLYANRITPSMQRALTETDRRRDLQKKYNSLNGITPRMALAASVGDSLLDSTMGDDMGFINARGIEPMTRQKQGARGDPGNQKTGTSIVSWAEPSLQPHQVQLMYDVSARRCGGEGRGRSHFPHRVSHDTSTSDDDRDWTETDSFNGACTVGDQYKDGTRSSLLAATDDTYRALKRLAERAADKMATAARKTDFKEAALWRDRRDEVLASMRDLELKGFAPKVGSVNPNP